MKRLTALLILFVPFMLTACDDPEGQGQQLPKVKVGPPMREVLTEWDEYTGRFAAINRVEIRARVSGYLQEIKFKDGQLVNEGDVLFIIDQRPFKIDLERAEARVELAEKEYERTSKLKRSSAFNQQQLDQRLQELRDAKAALEDAKLNLEFTEVKSPIQGRVSRHLADVGNLISGGDMGAQLLTTVVAEDPIHFYVEASEQELLKYIRQDMRGERESARTAERKVYVKLLDEDEFKHEGVIDFVDNEVDLETGSIEARAIFDNYERVLLPGLFGRLRIAGSGEYEAMLVPDRIIGTNQTEKFVYVLNADNQVEMRPVEIGPIHNHDFRIIRSGVSDEDRIIMDGIMRIRPGMMVEPITGDAPPPAPAGDAS